MTVTPPSAGFFITLFSSQCRKYLSDIFFLEDQKIKFNKIFIVRASIGIIIVTIVLNVIVWVKLVYYGTRCTRDWRNHRFLDREPKLQTCQESFCRLVTLIPSSNLPQSLCPIIKVQDTSIYQTRHNWNTSVIYLEITWLLRYSSYDHNPGDWPES